MRNLIIHADIVSEKGERVWYFGKNNLENEIGIFGNLRKCQSLFVLNIYCLVSFSLYTLYPMAPTFLDVHVSRLLGDVA